MGEWYEHDDDPMSEGIPTNWSGQLTGIIIAVVALIGFAARKMWMWLC